MASRAEQKEKRRAEIMETALDLFIKKGYSGTKIRDIADKLGMSLGLLFHYYASKEELYAELVKLGVSSPNQMVQGLMGLEPLAFFEKCAEFTLMYARQSGFTAKMFVFMKHAQISEDVPPQVKAAFSGINLYEGTVEMIKKGQENKTIKDGDPLALSTAFWSSIQGVIEACCIYEQLTMVKPECIVDIIKNHDRR